MQLRGREVAREDDLPRGIRVRHTNHRELPLAQRLGGDALVRHVPQGLAAHQADHDAARRAHILPVGVIDRAGVVEDVAGLVDLLFLTIRIWL